MLVQSVHSRVKSPILKECELGGAHPHSKVRMKSRDSTTNLASPDSLKCRANAKGVGPTDTDLIWCDAALA